VHLILSDNSALIKGGREVIETSFSPRVSPTLSVLKADVSLRMLAQMAPRSASLMFCLLLSSKKKARLRIFVNFDFVSINELTDYCRLKLDNHMME
jgi:hypothetical protein